jgi:hypothetical protein
MTEMKMQREWIGDAWFSPARYVGAVTAAGGRLLAAGEFEVIMLRPGEERTVETPVAREILALAACGAHPKRFAFATEDELAVFDGDDVQTFPAEGEDHRFDSLAWGYYDGGVTLWAIDGGKLACVWKKEHEGLVRFDAPEPIHKVYGDGSGPVLLVSDDRAGGWLVAGDDTGHPLLFPDDMGEFADAAVAGDALAVTDGHEVWVRRSRDASFERIEGLELGYPVTLAFEGKSSRSNLFVGYPVGEFGRCYRVALVDEHGRVSPVAEVVGEGEDSPALLQGLAWDDVRKTLWCAWHGTGLTFTRRAGPLIRLA